MRLLKVFNWEPTAALIYCHRGRGLGDYRQCHDVESEYLVDARVRRIARVHGSAGLGDLGVASSILFWTGHFSFCGDGGGLERASLNSAASG